MNLVEIARQKVAELKRNVEILKMRLRDAAERLNTPMDEGDYEGLWIEAGVEERKLEAAKAELAALKN